MRIPMDEWLRGCVYHDGRNGYVTLPCDEVLKIADFIEKLRADRKTEPTHDLRTETHECVKDTHDKTESTICDFCRYYNSNIPCGSTPSACKEADKFAEEFVNGLKDLRIIEADRKTESNSEKPNNYEPKTCDNCKLKGSTKWCDNQVVCRAYQPKDEPTISKMEQVDEPQTEREGE